MTEGRKPRGRRDKDCLLYFLIGMKALTIISNRQGGWCYFHNGRNYTSAVNRLRQRGWVGGFGPGLETLTAEETIAYLSNPNKDREYRIRQRELKIFLKELADDRDNLVREYDRENTA